MENYRAANAADYTVLRIKNIFFQFDKDQLIQFREYLANIDIEYWLDCYAMTTKKRKIPITTLHQNLVLIFNIEEIEDLKMLLLLREHPNDALSASDIDYTLVLN